MRGFEMNVKNRKSKTANADHKIHVKKGRTNTLSSMGIFGSSDAKTHNEYFGGDSTVVTAGDDEDNK
jgi:hypothetical protein